MSGRGLLVRIHTCHELDGKLLANFEVAFRELNRTLSAPEARLRARFVILTQGSCARLCHVVNGREDGRSEFDRQIFGLPISPLFLRLHFPLQRFMQCSLVYRALMICVCHDMPSFAPSAPVTAALSA